MIATHWHITYRTAAGPLSAARGITHPSSVAAMHVSHAATTIDAAARLLRNNANVEILSVSRVDPFGHAA